MEKQHASGYTALLQFVSENGQKNLISFHKSVLQKPLQHMYILLTLCLYLVSRKIKDFKVITLYIYFCTFNSYVFSLLKLQQHKVLKTTCVMWGKVEQLPRDHHHCILLLKFLSCLILSTQYATIQLLKNVKAHHLTFLFRVQSLLLYLYSQFIIYVCHLLIAEVQFDNSQYSCVSKEIISK